MKVCSENYLIQCIEYKYTIGVARSLLKGADPNFVDAEGLSALHYAVANDDAVSVALLVLAGADLRRRSAPDAPSLREIAVESGSAVAADMLVLGGAD